jgi:hypothetical protein
MVKKDGAWALFLGIAFLLIYLWRIGEITPGVWGDEITVGQTGLRLIKEKAITPFEPTNYGHPTPLLYLTGASLSLFGKSLWSLRLVSVIFGSLSASLMFLLVKKVSQNTHLGVVAATLLGACYPQVILARFAYEMTAAIFFELLAVYFLFTYRHRPSFKRSILVGGAVAMGLWTYLGFRSLGIALLVIFSKISRKISHILVVITSVILLTLPLLLYGLKQPDLFWARARSVSVFHQGLSPEEVGEELAGATKRTLGMFFKVGDPNPRQNPGQAAVFDWGTTLLALVGLGFGLIKFPGLSLAGILLLLTNLLNDIFTLERIPEFHYYGLGHPNTLRISTIVPVIIIFATYGLYCLGKSIKDKTNQSFFYYLVVGAIGLINLLKYFGQDISAFNYYVNGVPVLEAVKIINDNSGAVAASESFIKDQRFDFFVNKKVDDISLEEVLTTDSEEKYQLVVIDTLGQEELVNQWQTNVSLFETTNFLLLKQ